MTPTREQLIEDIAGKLWRDLCEGEGQHSEALDKSLIRKHMYRLAACLAAPPPANDGSVLVRVSEHLLPELQGDGMGPFARVRLIDVGGEPQIEVTVPPLSAPPPEPQAMPPIEIGDFVRARFGVQYVVDDDHAWAFQSCADMILEIRKANGTAWTREPRR